MQQPGNQLAARKIAGRTDEHDHLWKTWSDTRWNLRHGALPLLVENTPRGGGFTTVPGRSWMYLDFRALVFHRGVGPGIEIRRRLCTRLDPAHVKGALFGHA